MSNINQTLKTLRRLTDEERLEAQEKARAVIVRSIGDKPTRAAYENNHVSQYPAWFTQLVAAVMGIVFLAAAMPSLFRLFTAGRDYFLHGIDDGIQGAIVGVSTFVLAEFLIILSTISARVYFTGRARLVFIVPIIMGLAMALVGNWTVTQPTDLFGWLETLIPPSAVLFIALIGERLILDAIEARHANERSFQEALTEWQTAVNNPEMAAGYRAAYANALRDALRDGNMKGKGAKERAEFMRGLGVDDWRALVTRELKADSWFEEIEVLQVDTQHPEPDQAVIPVNPTIALNGHTNGAYLTTA